MWSKDFILLVQGQAVSCLGSTLYSVVASLWAYDLTGSALIMSAVYSATNIARLMAFPFAGVIADRFRRRDLIIICDILCGISMLAVAAAAATEKRWAVWALAVHSAVSGACSGIFNSSVNTLMLSITKKKHYVRANSIYSAIEYGVDMIGQGIAGTLYILIGAPCLFLLNGITFLFSAVTEMFISKDPKPNHREKKPFLKDAAEGIQYIVHNRGICCNLLIAFLINFVFGILKVVLVPWMLMFGEECYGLLGSFKSAGVIVGTVLLSLKNISENKQYHAYFGCMLLYVSCIAMSSFMTDFLPVAVLFCIAYANQYIFNTLQRSVVIIAAPDEVRGKVICAVQALAMAFSALGNLAGGVVCQWAQPWQLVLLLMVFLMVGIVFLGRQNSVKELFMVSAG